MEEFFLFLVLSHQWKSNQERQQREAFREQKGLNIIKQLNKVRTYKLKK